MTQPKIKIMISSRCEDEFPLGAVAPQKLSVIREELKASIEAEKIGGKEIFEVWINEDAPPNPADENSLEVCLKEARDADIFLCLYNGNAGWSVNKAGNGICHDELMTAYNRSPGKVIAVSIYQKNAKGSPKGNLNKKFQDYVDDLNLFRGGSINATEDLKARINETVREMALTLMHDGSREARKSAGDNGPALDWTRLNFTKRQEAMITTISESLLASEGAGEVEKGVMFKIDNKSVLFILHAIPSSFSVSAAREMVGQPFLKDYEHSSLLDEVGGPVHLIACTKGITEAQAMRLLGFPDAIIVKSGFGVYVADAVQKIQMCLISNCIDESSTRHQIQNFLVWLKESGEAEFLVERAKSRAKIVKLIAEEF